MYQQIFSSTYNDMIIFMFTVNFILMIRLGRTVNSAYEKHWILKLLFAGFVCVLSDGLCVMLSGLCGRVLFYLLNVIFYFSYTYISYLIFIYTLNSLDEEKKVSLTGALLSAIPLAIMLVILFISFWTGCIFYVDEEGVYSRGELYAVFFLIGEFYVFSQIGLSFYSLVKYHKKTPFLNQPIFYTIPILIGTFIQIFYPALPCSCMGLTITFLIVFMNHQEKAIRKSMAQVIKGERRQSQYHEALLYDSSFFFEFDVNEEYIINDIHITTDYDPFGEAGIELPVKYDELTEKRKNYCGYKADSELENSYWTCEGLLQAFAQGKRSVEINYGCEERDSYWRAIIILTEDPKDRHIHAVYLSKDVSESKEIEKKRQKELEQAVQQANAANAAKTSFLFNMSHDIRTPMNAIMGFTELLETNCPDEETRKKYISKIKDSSSILLSIINNVLEMSRIEKGTIQIENVVKSFSQFKDGITSVFSEMMKEKNLDFNLTIDVQHEYIYCDPTKVREIFINILSNAYKYTLPGGKINYTITEIPCEREGYGKYRCVVEDTGIGMSKDFIPHIFEEFSRENSTTDAKIEGTGLGMPIVKKLLDILGGTIEVESEKGKGSKFIVTLEYKIAEEKDVVIEQTSKINVESFKGKKILLAEDNELNAEIGKTLLESSGFIVDWVKDGQECLDTLKAHEEDEYDLILMDIQMPGKNGYEATDEIRKLPGTKKDIPVIAMTANAFEEDKKNALLHGMNGHISKPINVSVLLNTLGNCLNEYRV